MVRKTKAEAEITRQRVLEAALKVFSRQGYAAARLEDVADEAGVTRGAIYWHFKNKADLYTTLVGEVMERLEEVVERAVSGGRDFLDITRRVMLSIITLAEEDETYRAVIELTTLKTGYDPELEEGMRNKRAGMREIEAHITGYFRLAIANGELRTDLDPVIAARGQLAYINGVMVTWLLDQEAFSLRECAPALVEIYIRGIAAQP